MANGAFGQDLPLPMAPYGGDFRLDDLDFADDPLKGEIDFIDDSLLRPGEPGRDLVSGVMTSREAMGARPAQPTDVKGMRPEDYIAKGAAAKEDVKEAKKSEEAPKAGAKPAEAKETGPVGQGPRPLTKSQAAYAKAHPTMARERRARYGEARQAPPRQGQTAFQRVEALPRREGQAAYAKANAALGGQKRARRSPVVLMVAIAILISLFYNLAAGFLEEKVPEHEVTYPIFEGGEERADESWASAQETFLGILDEPALASKLGADLESCGVSSDMLDLLRDNAYQVTSEEGLRIYEATFNGLDVDLYEYEEDTNWLRFWSEGYDDVVDVGFSPETGLLESVLVNDEAIGS